SMYPSATPGKVYTVSAYARAPYAAGTFRIQYAYQNAAGNNLLADGSDSGGTSFVIDAPTTPATGGWQRIWATLPAAPAAAVRLYYRVRYQFPAGTVGVGDVFGVANTLCEESPVLGDYFDGFYSQDTDLTPAWTGTAHASTSTLSGVRAASVTDGPSRVALRSTQWARSGTHSVRIVPL